MIKTKSIYDPVNVHDGIRFIVMRWWPSYAQQQYQDIWHRELSPSISLLRRWRDKKVTWEEFKKAYIQEMTTNKLSMATIKLTKSMKCDVTLLCCEPESSQFCHRHILKELIKGSSEGQPMEVVSYRGQTMPDFVQIEKYGKVVWSSPEGEALRKTNCMCLNCVDIDECVIAKSLYEICKNGNLALMVTRCLHFRYIDHA